MTTAALARCPACRAIVNAHWAACLACREPLETDAQEYSTPSPPSSDWLQRWRSPAQIPVALSGDDPRYAPILTALTACHSAYKAGDRTQFTKEADNVMRIAAFVPGVVNHWRGADKKLQGPAIVNEVIYEEGRLWVCVNWAGHLHWVNEIIIVNIQTDVASKAHAQKGMAGGSNNCAITMRYSL